MKLKWRNCDFYLLWFRLGLHYVSLLNDRIEIRFHQSLCSKGLNIGLRFRPPTIDFPFAPHDYVSFFFFFSLLISENERWKSLTVSDTDINGIRSHGFSWNTLTTYWFSEDSRSKLTVGISTYGTISLISFASRKSINHLNQNLSLMVPFPRANGQRTQSYSVSHL